MTEETDLLFQAQRVYVVVQSENMLESVRGRREIRQQTCGDIMIYSLYRHCGICNGVPLLVLHNAPDATMHLHREGNSLINLFIKELSHASSSALR